MLKLKKRSSWVPNTMLPTGKRDRVKRGQLLGNTCRAYLPAVCACACIPGVSPLNFFLCAP